MAQVSQDILRMEILREAIERYKAAQGAAGAGAAERMLFELKIAECNAMLEELAR